MPYRIRAGGGILPYRKTVMRYTKAEAVQIFTQVERDEVTDEPAEAYNAMKGDWNGQPWNPPARMQPGVYAWGEAHLLLAYLIQYEATGDLRYLSTMVRRFRTLLNLRDDKVGRLDEVRGRMMPGWGSVRFSVGTPYEGKYTSWTVHVGMILYPVARLVHLATKDKALASRFADDLAEFRTAITESLDAYEDQWHERACPPGSRTGGAGEIEGWYTEPILGDAPLPTNQMNTFGRVILEMGLAGGKSRYLDRAEKLARFFKNRMVLRPDGAVQWIYRPGIELPCSDESIRAEDFSHAGMNVTFVVRCYHAGVVFNRTDMEQIIRTLKTVIYRGNGQYADFIDGTGATNQYADAVAFWGELAAIDRSVIDLIAERRRLSPIQGGPCAMLAAALLALFS